MKVRRILSLGMTGLIALFVLAACAQSNPDTNTNQGTDTGSDTTEDAGSDATSDATSDAGEDTAVEDVPVIPPPEFLGGDRPASYVLPNDYDPSVSMPLVLLLHGFTSSASDQDLYFGLSLVTKTQGMMLVLPDGMKNPDGNQYWNATDACCDFYQSGVDDVAYLSGVIEEAIEAFNIDTKRVFLVGHSNGGYMAHRLACERSDLIAGIVSLAGSTWYEEAKCGNPDPVAVLQVHGTWDTAIRYWGIEQNIADISAPLLDVDACIADKCEEEQGNCTGDPACADLIVCFEECEDSFNKDECNGFCWNSAPQGSRMRWMGAFVCALNGGCYDDPAVNRPGYPGAEEAVARWAAINGCLESVTEQESMDLLVEIPSADTVPLAHDNCPEGLQATVWKIPGGGHVPNFNGNWSIQVVEWLKMQVKP